jgi:hypothetical protein
MTTTQINSTNLKKTLCTFKIFFKLNPRPGVVKVLTVVYCEEGSRKKKCCTLYEHESNMFPNEELASEEEEEEEEKIKKVSKPLKISKKSKKPKKKDLIEDELYE